MRKTIETVRDWQIYLVIIIVGTIVYGKSVGFDFTYADDTQLVVMNQDVLGNFSNIPKLFETDAFISVTSPQLFYRPLMNVLFMIETHIGNDSPVVYHVTNVLLHLVCCLLVFKILEQLGCTKQLAGVLALLFCIHPLNASAVVWIPGRNDTMLAAFVLGSFFLLLRSLDTKRIGPLIGHFFLFFLALLTKETAVVFPLLTITYVYLFRRETPRRSVWILTIFIYTVLIIAWYALRSLVPETFAVHLKSDFLLASSMGNLPALLLYLGKVLFPFNLSIFPNLMDNSIWPGLASAILFLVVYVARKPSSSKGILWGFAWYLLFLVPTLISGIIFHEHRSYCAFLGLLFATSQLPLVQTLDLSRKLHALGFVALLAVFAIAAMVHSEQFRNRTAYATNAYVSDPSIDNSYASLAGLFIDDGNYDDAERVLRKGLARIPTMKTAHRMLADVLARRGDYPKAAQEYETYLRLDPLQLYTYIMYGKMCLDAGRADYASQLWKTSVTINPDYLLGYYYLANFYIHVKNDPDSAMMYAKQIQNRGETVMPDLLRAIQDNPLYGKRK